MVCLLFIEVFQRIVWHTILTLQHHSSGNDFWVSSSILAGTNVWPVTLELSKGKKDLHFQTMDKYCDDLLWLESLIDGWGQTLTLITEEITSLLASLTKSSHFLPSAECSPDGILHAFQQYMLCPIQVNIFFGLIPRLQVMMIHSIRKYCEGYSSSTGLKKMIKFCSVFSQDFNKMCANFQLGWCIWSIVDCPRHHQPEEAAGKKSSQRKVIESGSSYLGPPCLMARGE